jgi:hypothetical protein
LNIYMNTFILIISFRGEGGATSYTRIFGYYFTIFALFPTAKIAYGLISTYFLLCQFVKCITDLDLKSEIIIFKSFLTTFGVSIIFEATGAVEKIGLCQILIQCNQV